MGSPLQGISYLRHIKPVSILGVSERVSCLHSLLSGPKARQKFVQGRICQAWRSESPSLSMPERQAHIFLRATRIHGNWEGWHSREGFERSSYFSSHRVSSKRQPPSLDEARSLMMVLGSVLLKKPLAGGFTMHPIPTAVTRSQLTSSSIVHTVCKVHPRECLHDTDRYQRICR